MMKQLSLDTFLPYHLAVTADLVSRSLAKVYEGYDLTTPEWRILVHLQHHEHLTPTELGTLTNMDKARVTRALILMDKKELAVREASEQDKRVAHISLTEKGKDLFQQIETPILAWQQSFQAALSKEKQHELLSLLKQLNAWCGEHCQTT